MRRGQNYKGWQSDKDSVKTIGVDTSDKKDADVNDLARTSDKEERADVNNSNPDDINVTDNSPDDSDLSHVDPPHHDKAFTTALILPMLDVSDSNPPNIDQI